MLRKLVLENYRCYDSHTVEFSDKLTTIKGRNGTGKTSIVEAIGFALFGSALQRGKANEWIKQGEKTGRVVLYIDDYIVTRSPTLALVTNLQGETVARNNTGITAWVEKEYGLTAELFRTSFYIGQKDINGFSSLGAVERVKRVERLLRIDRLDEIKINAKNLLSAKAQTVQALKERLAAAEFDPLVMSHLLINIRKDHETLEDLRNDLEGKLIAFGEYQSKLTAYTKYVNLKALYLGKTYDTDKLEEELQELMVQNAKVIENNKIYNEKVRLERNLTGVTILPEYFTMLLSDVMNQERILLNYEKYSSLAEQLQCDPVEHLNLEELWLEIKDLTKQIAMAKSMPKACPTCGQPWPEKPINIKPLEVKLQEKELWYEAAKDELLKFEYLKKRGSKPAMSREDIKAATDSLNYRQDYLRLKDIQDYQKLEPVVLKSRQDTLKVCIEQNRHAAKLEELGVLEKPEEVNTQVIRDSILFTEKEIRKNELELKELQTAEAIHDEYGKLYDSQHAEVKKLREFISFIDKYRKAFGQNVIPLLEANVSSIVNFLSEGKYEKVIINPDYSIQDFDFFSGSEQDSVSFALRLALAQVSRIGGFKTMLLDEVAASFDNEREALLMKVLDSQDNQLVYITHGEI